MRIRKANLPGVLVLEPRVFADERGFFLESYSRRVLKNEAGVDVEFVQDNHSKSARGVIRGLHYQIQRAQGKLVRVVAGSVFDVAVDVRRSSPTFGQWFGCELSAQNRFMLWIPVGYAHGFCALADGSEVVYKVTDYWAPEYERTVLWNDGQIGIEWPEAGHPIISAKDRLGTPLEDAEVFP